MHALDIRQNVSRWQKRDTILESLIQMVCSTSQKFVTIHLKRDMILGSFLSLFILKLF